MLLFILYFKLKFVLYIYICIYLFIYILFFVFCFFYCFSVLSQIYVNTYGLRSIWYEKDPKFLEALSKLVLKIFSPLVDKYGFDYAQEESYIDSKTRTLVLKVAGFFGDKK